MTYLKKAHVLGGVIAVVIIIVILGSAYAGLVPILSPLLRGGSSPSPSSETSPSPLSEKTFTITSSSMEPTIKQGATVFVQVVPFESLQVNDIIVYKQPYNQAVAIVSRVVQINANGLVTQGDSNGGPDPWNVTAPLLIGKVVQINNP